MAERNVILAIDDAAAMGRGVIHGVASYPRATDAWTFAPITPDSRLYRGSDVSPRSADAIIGVITSDIAALWRGPHRRFVVNVSRGQHVAGAANVTCDDAAIGRMAGEYLRDKGLDHFAFFGSADSGVRARAFIDAVRRPGRSVPWIERGRSTRKLPAALRRLPRPCGVLAFNDIAAVQLIRLARTLQIDVPGDLAVIGVDNDVLVNVLSPVQLTSVAVDFDRVGYEAVRILDGILRGGDPPPEPIRIPPTEVIERNSTDFPGRFDPLAVRAARAVRQQACGSRSVPQMIEDLPASYRTIDRRFRKAFGRSLQSELTGARMAEAARLLSTTRLPLAAIAEQVGYANANYFNTVFRKRMGTPPGAYRRQNPPTSRPG